MLTSAARKKKKKQSSRSHWPAFVAHMGSIVAGWGCGGVGVMKDKGKEMMMQRHCYSPRYASLIARWKPSLLTGLLHVSSDKNQQTKKLLSFKKRKKTAFGRGRSRGVGVSRIDWSSKICIAGWSSQRHLLLSKHCRKDPNYCGYLQTRMLRCTASITFSTLVKFVIFTSLYAKRLRSESGTSLLLKEGSLTEPKASLASSKWPNFQSAKWQIYFNGLFVCFF